MDGRSGTRNWSFGPAHVGAVFSQQHPDSIVQGLREALFSAITQIKSLEVKNKALKEQAGLMENRQMEVSQLQEELKQKDDLLKRSIKKRRARAHVDTLVLLTQKEIELKRSEEQWRRTCDVLEASLISKTNQLQKLTLKNTKKQKQLVKKVKKEQEKDKTKEEEEDENEKKRKKEKEKMGNEQKEKVKKEKKEKMGKEQKEKAKEDGKERIEKEQKEKVKKEKKENMEKEQIEKVKKVRKEKMENIQNENEMKRSEEKEMNDKKSEIRRGGVTSRRWVQTDRHQYRGRNCWFNSSQTSVGDPSY